MAEKRPTDVHDNVQPVHPKQTGARCPTCHAADNVELLELETGEHATLDESYRLCAECHVAQVNAWAHGAHGKRLDGWQGRRVVMPCTDCHDPHSPALVARIPFRAPQVERTRGGDP
jgi:formate-dependent nitrite reductase cytochrome c552 subunit